MKEVVRTTEAVFEDEGVVVDRLFVLQHVEHIGGRRATEQQSATRCGVHNAVPSVHGNREHRALLPLEDVLFGVPLLPHLGGASTLDHEVDLLVHVFFWMQGASWGHLHHVATPFGLRTVELNVVALAPGALPRHQG